MSPQAATASIPTPSNRRHYPNARSPARNRFEALPAPAIHSRSLNYKEFMHTTVCMVTATLAGSFGVGPALFWSLQGKKRWCEDAGSARP